MLDAEKVEEGRRVVGGVCVQMVWLERKRGEKELVWEAGEWLWSGRLFFFGRDQPVGGPIVMQRCINNATGLLNAVLPWGSLWLTEQ